MYTEDKMLPIKITDEQRTELEKRNAEIDIKVIVAAETLDEAKAIYKSNTESISKEKKSNLQTLRQGYEMKVVTVSEYVDEEQGTIRFYDTEGLLVHERALSMEERRQYKIQFNSRRELAD